MRRSHATLAKRVRLLAVEPVVVAELRDRRAQARASPPSGRGRRRCRRGSGRLGARRAARRRGRTAARRREVLAHGQPHDDVHRRLDRRAAHLAVALGGVRVAEREQRALDADRQYSVVPGLRCFVSRLPPQRDGGTIECAPGSGRATPSVPGNGRNGSVMRSAKRTRPSRRRPARCAATARGTRRRAARSRG